MADYSFYSHLYQPHTKWPKLEKTHCRLSSAYSFDLEELRAEFNEISKEFPLKSFEFIDPKGAQRKRTSYRGIGLTSSVPASGEDGVYDALKLYNETGEMNIYDTFKKVSDKLDPQDRQLDIPTEAGFKYMTEACTPGIQKILGRFKSELRKVRFIELKPGGFIPFHVDFPYYQGIRLHAVLYSNEDVVWQVEDEKFKLPCDGHFYWFDTGKYHGVRNDGKTTRIILSVNLSVYFNRDGQQVVSEEQSLLDLFERGEI